MPARLDHNNGALRKALRTIRASLKEDVLIPVAKYGGTRTAARATSQHMRDAKGEPKRRDPEDGGPLRIVTGDYVTQIKGGKAGQAGGVPTVIESTDSKATMSRVADLEQTPQAYNERGSKDGTLPARPHLGPALEMEAPRIRKYATRKLKAALQGAMNKLLK